MQYALITVIVVHVLAATFWAGSTFALTRLGGEKAEQLFPAQMGAATLVVLTGAQLWGQLHRGAFNLPEQMLAVGVVATILAAGVQGALIGPARRRLSDASEQTRASLRGRMAIGNRIAAALLAITLATMAGARFV